MKTIGLVGGSGWASTLEYYKIINNTINQRLGGLQSGEILVYSFNYADINAKNKIERHDEVQQMVIEAAKKLTGIGADCILLCANTLHLYADNVEQNIDVPLLHIAEATGKEIKKLGVDKVGLLGARLTMEMDFYKSKLAEMNIETTIPNEEEREFINDVIFKELLLKKFLEESKEKYIDIINRLKKEGAHGIILGCTEIPLLIKQKDINVPVFNTLKIHAEAAVDFAISE